ncbi:MAG TPA: hypothetical protein VFO57_05285 [Burkholderiales bacterium]|nr:hypothetical protein [Burkholderiales bacterium]
MAKAIASVVCTINGGRLLGTMWLARTRQPLRRPTPVGARLKKASTRPRPKLPDSLVDRLERNKHYATQDSAYGTGVFKNPFRTAHVSQHGSLPLRNTLRFILIAFDKLAKF